MNFTIPTLDDITQPALAARLQHLLDNKTKPLGSLGRLEALAQRIGLILGTASPELTAPQLVVFAGDHGLAVRGVSAYPSDVTWQMVENFLAGGAAVSVLARQHGIGLTVVDCGVKHDFAERTGLLIRKIEHGTADALEGPAMSAAQCAQAIANGREVLQGLPGNALLLGEMGIGNTSAASMLLARLAGLDVSEVTGAGTGLDAAAVQRKIGILREVLSRHAGATAPLDALAAFGGFEIATLVGAVLQAAEDVVWSWSTASSPPLPCWWPATWHRTCCSAACSRTAPVNAATPSCSRTSRPSRCWIWACAWARVLARRWPGRCW
jgi:nicotinate-nucleotide--dimethylbenzimidazole phosphoribosyltransferase